MDDTPTQWVRTSSYRGEVWLARFTAMRSCDVAVEVTSIAHALGGAAAVYAGSRLLRALLDVQTGRQHLLFGHQHRPAIGAALAGRDVTYPPFLM
jgi:hypothetical protein